MAKRTESLEQFTRAQMTAYLWHKQGFARAAADDPNAYFHHPFGIYATAPTCYLSLLARHADFRFADLTRVVEEERAAVRIRAMRYSNFIIPVDMLPAVYQALKRFPENPITQIKLLGYTDADYEAAAAAVEDAIDGKTMTATEIKKALPADVVARLGQAWSYVVPQMCADGRLVRAAVRGGWKSDMYAYARFDQWLPGIDLNSATREDGQVIVARAYLDDYAPATAADVRWWSGFSKPEATRALDALADELVTIDVDGTPYLMLAANLDALRAAPDQLPRGVRLLPIWDAYLMAYKDRTRYLRPEHYDRVYDKVGNATSVLLVDGRVGGVWDMSEDKGSLEVKAALFEPDDDSVWQALADEAARLAQAAGASSFRVLRCDTSPDLKTGARNLFMSPLKDVVGVEIARG